MKITKAQNERLLLLMEECAEVSQAASKIIRFGFQSKHPRFQDGPTNFEHLNTELGGLCAIINLMNTNKEISLEQIDKAQDDKLATIHKYTTHQGVK